ncbi:DNA-directed RNA polymerase subunit beta (plasmid) [Nocardia terpenica]|uniref:DNA-directed RNA polymerase subunit beta n=1 Tax=Nocardia terpenica TaxID=455432 RepID=A0A291RYE3_9NOCA|nr:DNA-directed RNA polymerase subunit beta [Nocardia terpenica]
MPSIPADTLTSRCEYYRRTCELDAHVQPELQAIIVIANSSLGSITMPAELAARVRLHLQRQGERLGPVISHPRSSRWTFLVRPDIPDDAATFARLFRMQIAVSRTGTQIALPSPVRRHSGFRCWSQAPTGAYRPSGVVVLAAVDACAVPSRRARPVHSA